MNCPEARRTGLTVRELAEETLVYDLERNKAHCLNRTAGLVWRHCDGRTARAQLAGILHEKLGLPADERLILEAAGLLHEVGYLINYERHHQHSYHLILHGNLRGLSSRQRELVANVARYVTAPDGTHHLVCQGVQRFRVVEFLGGYPYLVARVNRANSGARF